MPFCQWKIQRQSLQTPHDEKTHSGYLYLCRRAALCASGKGSITLEAALALPLFLCAAAALICLFSIFAAQARKERTLMEQAQLLAVTVGQEKAEDPYLVLCDRMPVQLPFSGVFSGKKHAVCKAEVRVWIGYSGESFTDQNSEIMVYMTPEGTVYHRNRDCTYLALTIRTISCGELDEARNLSGGKYGACEYCVKNQAVSGTVYITDYGTSYHRLRDCQGLKRTVMAVPLSETGGLKSCSRCGSL